MGHSRQLYKQVAKSRKKEYQNLTLTAGLLSRKILT
jgi:hypothetical protein